MSGEEVLGLQGEPVDDGKVADEAEGAYKNTDNESEDRGSGYGEKENKRDAGDQEVESDVEEDESEPVERGTAAEKTVLKLIAYCLCLSLLNLK